MSYVSAGNDIDGSGRTVRWIEHDGVRVTKIGHFNKRSRFVCHKVVRSGYQGPLVLSLPESVPQERGALALAIQKGLGAMVAQGGWYAAAMAGAQKPKPVEVEVWETGLNP